MTDLAQYRFRIWFRKGEPLKYISHLDLLRAWERILRRAELPLAYSQGFNPHPKIVIAMPLAVGCTGRNEAVDIILTEELAPEQIRASISSTLPEGMSAHGLERVDLRAPAMPSCIEHAVYRIALRDLPLEEAEYRVQELTAQGELQVRFRRKTFDLRPLVGALEVEYGENGVVLEARLLRNERGRIGRPDVLVDAMGLADHVLGIERTRISFDLEECS